MKDLREKIFGILCDITTEGITHKELQEATNDIIKLFNEDCTCTSEETTGWTTFKNCNVCGRVVR